MSRIPSTPPIPIGTVLKHGGRRHKVAAVGVTGGERYYWLIGLGRVDGAVSMMPADVVETWDTHTNRPEQNTSGETCIGD